MSARPVPDSSPTASELESGMHALGSIFEILFWLEHDKMPKSDQQVLEVKHGLLLAGQLITEDFRRRF